MMVVSVVPIKVMIVMIILVVTIILIVKLLIAIVHVMIPVGMEIITVMHHRRHTQKR